MTALERAKAFIQSRAAKTALRILPLALATVTVVGVSTKAHATQTTFSGTFTNWHTPNCNSGGIAACLNPAFLSPGAPAPYMTNGAQAAGTATGTYETLISPPGGPVTLEFLMSGLGTGDLTNPVAIEYNFSVTCAGCASTDTFTYDVAGLVDNTTSAMFSADTGVLPPIAQQTTPPSASGTFFIPSVSGTAQDFETAIEFTWNGQNGETATFDVTRLAIYPTSGTNSVPEPSSLLLAFTGLPFLARALRKKR